MLREKFKEETGIDAQRKDSFGRIKDFTAAYTRWLEDREDRLCNYTYNNTYNTYLPECQEEPVSIPMDIGYCPWCGGKVKIE